MSGQVELVCKILHVHERSRGKVAAILPSKTARVNSSLRQTSGCDAIYIDCAGHQ
jgi:hypothetical protein